MLREQTKYARRQKIGGLKRWVATLFGLNLVQRREAERSAAVAAFKATIRSKDTRAQHRAYIAALDATNAALRAEVR